jgi:hypothetical protein
MASKLIVACILACISSGPLDPACAQDAPTGGAGGSTPAKPKPAKYATRKQGGRTDGSSAFTEKAVLDGMRWLVRHQNADGSWSVQGLSNSCRSSPPCNPHDTASAAVGDVGATSLALASFLAAGFSQLSTQEIVDTPMGERHRIGPVVDKGLSWLIQQQGDDGGWPGSNCGLQAQALATLTLCDAYGMTEDERMRGPAQKGVDALLRTQTQGGADASRSGWKREGSIEGDDVDATSWSVQALHTARVVHLTVDPKAFEGAWKFSESALKEAVPSKAGDARVPKLALIRILSRPDRKDPVLKRAIDSILATLGAVGPDKPNAATDYVTSFVMSQVHGMTSAARVPDAWKRWITEWPPTVTASQEEMKLTCHAGGWLAPDASCPAGSPVVATALRMLALESFYRYESVFTARK